MLIGLACTVVPLNVVVPPELATRAKAPFTVSSNVRFPVDEVSVVLSPSSTSSPYV